MLVLPTASKFASRSIRPFTATEVVLLMKPNWLTLLPARVTSARGASINPLFVAIPPYGPVVPT